MAQPICCLACFSLVNGVAAWTAPASFEIDAHLHLMGALLAFSRISAENG